MRDILALFVIAFLLFPGIAFANLHPTLGVPPGLIGSEESLARQNEIADKYGFKRIKNLSELRLLVCAGVLEKVVPTRGNPTYYLTAEKRFRYARPEVTRFISDQSKKFFENFGRPWKITEIIRDEPYQKLLARRGKTQADGKTPERRSAHLTGAAFDVSRKGMTEEEKKWMRDELVYWKDEGLIEAVEEIYGNAFHIMVFPNYSAPDPILATDDELIESSGCKIPKPKPLPKRPMKKSPKKAKGSKK